MKIKWKNQKGETLTGVTVVFTNTPEGTKAIVLEDMTSQIHQLSLHEFEVFRSENNSTIQVT